jgi:Tol biopolymer transport system component
MAASAWPVGWTTAGRIVFRTEVAPAGLWSISQTGGSPAPLFRGAGVAPRATIAVGGSIAATADVSRDGNAIAFFGRGGPQEKWGIWIGALTGSPPSRYEPAPFESDYYVNVPKVRLSPDGTQILLLRNATHGEEAWLLPYPPDAGNPPRRIFESTLPPAEGTPSVAWMPDSRRLIMAISSGLEPSRLFMADTVTGEFSLLSGGTTSASQPAVSPDGTRLVFTESETDYDVVNVHLQSGRVTPLLATRRQESMPAWALNAPAMAYDTNRTGESEVWLHEPGHADRPLVTARDFPRGTTVGFLAPALSPDGKRIIYTRISADGPPEMWLSAVSGGVPVRVTDGPAEQVDFSGAWSPDGEWFVFRSGETLNRVRTTGQAKPDVVVPVVPRSAGVPVWSPTGQWILYSAQAGWRLVSPDGKTERDLALQASVCGFSRNGTELYCAREASLGGVLFSRPVAGGPDRMIATLQPSQLPAAIRNPSLRITLTPDGQHVTFSVRSIESNLWLLEGIGPKR